MKLEFEHTIGLPRKVLWSNMKDAGILKNSLNGCKDFVETSKGIYHSTYEINFGPIQDVFMLEIIRAQEKSPSYYQLLVKGKGKLGEIDGKADLWIKEGQGSSRVILKADAELTGTLAIAGKKIEGGAKKSIENFFQKLEKEIKRNIYMQKRGR